MNKIFYILMLVVSGAYAADPYIRTRGTVVDGDAAVFDGASGRYVRSGVSGGFALAVNVTAVSNRVNVIEGNTNDWDTAYGWGDHNTNGYLTAEVQGIADVLTINDDANSKKLHNLLGLTVYDILPFGATIGANASVRIDMSNAALYGFSHSPSLDWGNRGLTGDWEKTTAGVAGDDLMRYTDVETVVAAAGHAVLADYNAFTASSNLFDGELYTTGNVGIGTTTPATALEVVGDITVQGHILPSASNTYDLGSATMPFRSGYFSAATVYIGDTTLSSSGSDLLLNGTSVVDLVGASYTRPCLKLELRRDSGAFMRAHEVEIKASTNNFVDLVYYVKTWTTTGVYEVTGDLTYPTADDDSYLLYFNDPNQGGGTRGGIDWETSAIHTSIESQLTYSDSRTDVMYFWPSRDCEYPADRWMWQTNANLVWSYVIWDLAGPETNTLVAGEEIWNILEPVNWVTTPTTP